MPERYFPNLPNSSHIPLTLPRAMIELSTASRASRGKPPSNTAALIQNRDVQTCICKLSRTAKASDARPDDEDFAARHQ